MYMRSLEEIIDQAVENAKSRLKEAEPKQRVVKRTAKRTGNKKALHQKKKNNR